MGDLPYLLMRSSVLKRQLVDYAHEPRFDRHLTPLLEAAAVDGKLEESEAIRVTDDFIMRYQFPGGGTVIDRFLWSRKDLDPVDREMLLRWRDPVDGIFEVVRTEDDASIFLNLFDDMEYRVYSNTGRSVADFGAEVAFVATRLVPLDEDSWVISGILRTYGRGSASTLVQTVMELAAQSPALAFRNPEKVRLGWERMRAERDRFIEFFGADEILLSPAETEARINAYLGGGQAFTLPPPFFEHRTVGVIYDQNDGLMFLPGYGILRELFEDPRLAADEEHAEALLGYLESESINPGPLRRLAESHQDTVDKVFSTVLNQRSFRWADQGEELLRERKPWYFEREPLPCYAIVGERLLELAAQGPPEADLDALKVPKAMRSKAESIIDLTDRVCYELLDDEYMMLARKAVAALARKRPSPLSSGRAATWAGAVVYALGQINFLFDRESKPYATADDLSEAFGVSKSTLSTKAKQVRDALKLDYGSVEYLTEKMVDASPMVWFVSVDGLIMDARSLSLSQQTQAYLQGVIPYIPALGREGTAQWDVESDR